MSQCYHNLHSRWWHSSFWRRLLMARLGISNKTLSLAGLDQTLKREVNHHSGKWLLAASISIAWIATLVLTWRPQQLDTFWDEPSIYTHIYTYQSEGNNLSTDSTTSYDCGNRVLVFRRTVAFVGLDSPLPKYVSMALNMPVSRKSFALYKLMSELGFAGTTMIGTAK